MRIFINLVSNNDEDSGRTKRARSRPPSPRANAVNVARSQAPVVGNGRSEYAADGYAVRDPQVTSMYSYVRSHTALMHITGVNLPSGKVRSAKANASALIRAHKSRVTQLNTQSIRRAPSKTVSEGYGEITQGSADKIFQAMKLKKTSRFLDIGSGHGKVVFHACMQFDCQAHGIEYANFRHVKAVEMMGDMASRDGTFSRLQKASLSCADATTGQAFDATHIYIFDKLFTETVCTPLAERLNCSPFEWLASTKKPAEWTQFGLVGVREVCRVRIATTGNESMTFFVYKKMR